MTTYTHWLVLDKHDASVLAWFPKSERGAHLRAKELADDTGHNLTEGYWDNQWVHDGPQGLKDLLRF